jgi:hypothetical protein
MIKKLFLLALLVCSLLAFFSPGVAQAAGGPNVTDSSVQVNFPAGITFNISVASDVNITGIRLHYIVNRASYTRVVSEILPVFTPSPDVTAQWVWDMRKTGGLPAGASVDYWWTVTDAGGKTLETAPARIDIKDNRYTWRSLNKGQVTLYWYKGDDAFAGELMTAIQDALVRISGNTGAKISKPVSFYIYASAADLQGSMIFAQEWTGGVAFTEYSIIAIGIGTSRAEIDWGKRTVAHELTHLVINQLTLNPYNGLPTWLDEGLAMYSEGALDAQFTTALSSAKSQNSFISVRSIASPFSAYANLSVLSYAESYEIIKYLIDTYGQPEMFELLSAFQQGSGYDDALNKVYGFDMDGLNAKWLASFGVIPVVQPTVQPTVQPAVQPVVKEGIPSGVIGLLAGLVAGLLLIFALFIERWAWRRGW